MQESVSNVVLEGHQTKEGFIRDSLIEIYSSIDAPVTIDSLEISEAHESTYQILSQTMEYDINYTAEIGYDREEQYIVQEKKYDRDLQRDIVQNVVKTRTVTDWRPHSGSAFKEGVAAKELTNNDNVDLGEDDNVDFGNVNYYIYNPLAIISSGIISEDEEKYNAVDFVEPTAMDIQELIEDGFARPQAECKAEMPGDHNRNVNISYKATKVTPTIWAVNRFKTAFTFDGKTHFVRQFVCEPLPQVLCSYRGYDDEIENIKDKCAEEIKADPEYNKYIQYNKYSTFGIIGGIALFILSYFIISSLSFLFPVGLLTLIASLILKFKVFKPKAANRKKEIQKKYDSMKNEHEKEVQAQKAEKLNARFAMMGLEPLTEKELERFDLENKHSFNSLGNDAHKSLVK